MRLEIEPFDYYYVDCAGYNRISISLFGEDIVELKVGNKYDPEAVLESFKSNLFKTAIELTKKEFNVE